jgi:hypothetical protein
MDSENNPPETGPPLAAKTPMAISDVAAFINIQTGALLFDLSKKLAGLQPQNQGSPQDISGLKPARPRILSALYCLCVSKFRDNDPGADPQQFNQFLAGVRAELKLLHPEWKGPFSFETTLRQGEGLYLRNAPNLTELVRSKPDYVFEEEWHKVQKSDDWLALFILKAKIQILEAMRIQTHNPAHVPMAEVIRQFITAALEAIHRMQPVIPEVRAQL